jgi:hypothetical protein
MGKQFAKIGSEHKAFIERQKIFFVASAPPKGDQCFTQGAVVIPGAR